MIGDWYAFRGHPYKCTASDIASIAECEEKGAQTDISEIPLTPEILEKNGFVNKKGRFMQKGNFDDPPLIMWHLIDDKILGHPKSQLEIHHGEESIHVSLLCIYVHELQHALRLCGIEKEIVL